MIADYVINKQDTFQFFFSAYQSKQRIHSVYKCNNHFRTDCKAVLHNLERLYQMALGLVSAALLTADLVKWPGLPRTTLALAA